MLFSVMRSTQYKQVNSQWIKNYNATYSLLQCWLLVEDEPVLYFAAENMGNKLGLLGGQHKQGNFTNKPAE